MQVGLSGIVTPSDWSFPQFVATCREAGYAAAELPLRDQGWLTLDTPAAELRAAAAHADAEDLHLASVALLVSGVDFMTNDAAAREAALAKVLRGLEVTAALGVDTLLVTPGRIGPDCPYDDAYYNALGALRSISPQVAAIGVNLALEYVWNWFLLSPLEYRRFLDDVDCPQIGFFFDSGNMVLQGYPEQWARILGRHLMMVHLKDFRRADHSWPPLGQGDVDFPAVMAELRRLGYDGALLSEVDPGVASFAETAQAIRAIMEA